MLLEYDKVRKVLSLEEGPGGLTMTFPAFTIRVEDTRTCRVCQEGNLIYRKLQTQTVLRSSANGSVPSISENIHIIE